jgi:DNA-binding transcriptional LysR family regulator
MSRSLARLREHFNDRLLVPKGRELRLSPKAQALLPAVEAATVAINDVFDDGEQRGPAARRTFVVVCTDLFATAIAPELVAEVVRCTPRSSVEVRAIPERSTEKVLGGDTDVALGVFEDVPPTVNQRHLFSDTFACVVREDHPRVSSTLTLRDYLELAHLEILPAPNARPSLRIERALGAKAARRRVAVRVPYFSTAAHILARSDLVSTMTRAWAKVLQEAAPLRIVDAPLRLPPLRFSQVWNRRHDGDRAHAWFRDLVARICVDRFGDAL